MSVRPHWLDLSKRVGASDDDFGDWDLEKYEFKFVVGLDSE